MSSVIRWAPAASCFGPCFICGPTSPRLALHSLQPTEQPAPTLPPHPHEHSAPDLPAEHEAHGEHGPEHGSPARAKGLTCQAPRLRVKQREVKSRDLDLDALHETSSVRPHLVREQHSTCRRGDPEQV